MAKRPTATVDKTWLGFDSRNARLLAGADGPHGLVAPGATAIITSRPQIAFRGERIFTHLPIASSFLIHSLRIGNAEQTAGYGPIPADAFATRMDRLAEIEAIFKRDEVFELKIAQSAYEILGAEWPLPAAPIAADITFTVENIGVDPARFLAGLLGERLDHY